MLDGGDLLIELFGRVRIRGCGARVGEGGPLDDEVDEGGEEHDARVERYRLARHHTEYVTLHPLRPDFLCCERAVLRLLDGVARHTISDAHATSEDAQTPRDGQEHDCRARERAHAHLKLLLGARPEAREEHDRAVRHGAQDWEDDGADDASEGRYKEQELRALAQHVGSAE